MNRTFVQIDTETLALTPNAVVLSIGAVAYDRHGIFSRIEVFPSISEQVAAGREIDDDTFSWWLMQTEAARRNIATGKRESLEATGQRFSDWYTPILKHYTSIDNTYFSAYGIDFDLPVVTTLLSKYGKLPWEGKDGYRQKLCLRTVQTLYKDDFVWPSKQVAHTALADAESQAEAHLLLMRKHISMG